MTKMDPEQLKKIIKLAREAVDDEPEPYKTEAFKISFSKLLEQELSEHTINNTKQVGITSIDQNLLPEATDFNTRLTLFAQKCRLTLQELKDVFYTDKELIYLISPLPGSEAEKQTLASQCILTAYELLFEKEWLEAPLLMKCIDLSGIGQIDHFARNIRKKQIIRIRGKGKGKSLEYKITGLGRLQAFEIIHDLAKGEST